MTDMLTGCPNRRYAMDRINQEWAMAVRTERPLACMVVDMDNLKQINDALGHEAGDRALKLVASAFKGEMRAQEVLARSGGDEFIVICPDTPLDAAMACAERMRAAAAAMLASSVRSKVCGPLRLKPSTSVWRGSRDSAATSALPMPPVAPNTTAIPAGSGFGVFMNGFVSGFCPG